MEEKYKLYLELNKHHKSPEGFQASHECDSLLWTGLSACNPDNPADLLTAIHPETKQFHRRPISMSGNCCGCWNPPENQPSFFKRLLNTLKGIKELGFKESYTKYGIYKGGSTISRDMLIGAAYYSYYRNRPDIAKIVIKSAIKGLGKVGKGDPFRTGIRLPLLITFCLILYKIGGKKYSLLKPLLLLKKLPVSGNLTGYRAHLEVLHILLRRDIIGIGQKEKQALANYSRCQPRNPLFLYATDKPLAAKEVLMDNRLWPSNRLPTSKDRKEEWLMQRDESSDWKPDNSKLRYHNGADFLFMYWLLNKDKKNG